MLVTEYKKSVFRFKEIWFADEPEDVDGCDSVIYRACEKAVDKDGFTRSEFPTFVIDLTQPLETIWANMDKKSTRYVIKKAEKEGIIVHQSIHCERFFEFYDKFTRLKGYTNIINRDVVRQRGWLYVARANDKVDALLAAQVYLADKLHIRWLHGAREMGVSLASDAMRLLIWETIKRSKEAGMISFDFGGRYEEDEKPDWKAISDFKASFGGKPVTHYIYTKDYSKALKMVKAVKGAVK